jgi:predicted dehydrogenase
MSEKSAKVKVGVIGCGNISDIYFQSAKTFSNLEIIACASERGASARTQALRYDIPYVLTPAELLNHPEIEIVLNLSIPKTHYALNLAALEAGKSVYSEKPLALNREEGSHLLETAARRGLKIGCAPDTFLGAGYQTARKLLQEGAIGEPVAGVAFFGWRGPEEWHPDPQFLFEEGGGPLFDMSPYYLTALVTLLGAVRRVSSISRITWPVRPIMNPQFQEKKVTASVATHVAGLLEFENGVIVNLIASFDILAHNLPRIEIYGSHGSLSLPDPNFFGGPVKVSGLDREWREASLVNQYVENHRGIGMSDLALAIRENRWAQASGELAYHVLDVMQSLNEAAANQGRSIEVATTLTNVIPTV